MSGELENWSGISRSAIHTFPIRKPLSQNGVRIRPFAHGLSPALDSPQDERNKSPSPVVNSEDQLLPPQELHGQRIEY
ncbi:hypothetical protein OUZ56_018452 [Daphnia magna]|uniref:Uncharacterized protein n=1 Tax=Daphnia magna TaxID=35525 RepID=A0ABQ9Z8W4_9CRUS|nr:hypothetical protein OUZ56_018452 [Daphnia magna]